MEVEELPEPSVSLFENGPDFEELSAHVFSKIFPPCFARTGSGHMAYANEQFCHLVECQIPLHMLGKHETEFFTGDDLFKIWAHPTEKPRVWVDDTRLICTKKTWGLSFKSCNLAPAYQASHQEACLLPEKCEDLGCESPSVNANSLQTPGSIDSHDFEHCTLVWMSELNDNDSTTDPEQLEYAYGHMGNPILLAQLKCTGGGGNNFLRLAG